MLREVADLCDTGVNQNIHFLIELLILSVKKSVSLAKQNES